MTTISDTAAKTFGAGTWVVSKLSFGQRIHQMQVAGEYCSVTKPLKESDFDKILVSVLENGHKVFEGLRKDYKGDHSIFPTFQNQN